MTPKPPALHKPEDLVVVYSPSNETGIGAGIGSLQVAP